jgi:hypothetical protein
MKKTLNENDAREEIRSTYGKIAQSEGPKIVSGGDSACCSPNRPSATEAGKLGYSADEIAALPDGADLGS